MDKVLRFFGFIAGGIGILLFPWLFLGILAIDRGWLDLDDDWQMIGLAGLTTALEIVWVSGIVYLVLNLISQ